MSTTETAPAAVVQRQEHVMVITLNRPQARNAVNSAVSTAVGDALAAAQADPEVRAVILTGAGDLKAAARGENLAYPEHPEWGFAGYVHHFVDKPTIAAVNGSAFGGGAELVLASDLAVADERATFGLPEVKRGLIAGAGGAFRIVEQLPTKIALELLLTGEPIAAAVARKWGLINQVVADGTALQAALALAQRIAVNAPLSVQASKRVAYGAVNGSIGAEEAKWAQLSREAVAVKKTQDAAEGLQAFAQRRQPVWKAR